MLDKVLQWMTAELKQELRASKVNQTGERRVFDEALQRMTAELKQEIRATKVNQTVEGKVKLKDPMLTASRTFVHDFCNLFLYPKATP